MMNVALDSHRGSVGSRRIFAALTRRVGFASGAFALVLACGFVTTPAQATPIVAGAIAGAPGVSASGAATYGIPIMLPPGTQGLQPSLSLVYNSQSGNGLAGYGWTLTGFSAIARCNKTIEDDGITAGIVLRGEPDDTSNLDNFCLDGQELKPTGSGAYGADGTTYDTEMASFAVITAHSDSGATHGPSWFTVQTRDGRTYEYGHTTDSKVYAQGTNIARVWALSKVTDANANYMLYTYQQDTADGDYWPIQIDYTGNGGYNPAYHHVVLDYTANAGGMIDTAFVGGTLISRTQHLTGIEVKYDTNVSDTYSYTLGYDTDNTRYLLNSVTECGAAAGNAAACMQPTAITWQKATGSGWGADVSTGVTVPDLAHAQSAHLMDVDGDGIQDLVYAGTHWMVMFGQPGGGFGTPQDTGQFVGSAYQYALGMDYDGDGRADLAMFIPTGPGWQVMTGTGSQSGSGIFSNPGNSLPNVSANNSVTGLPIYEGNVWASDFSGSGKSDIVYTNGSTITLTENSEGFGTLHTAYTTTNINRDDLSPYADVGADFEGAGRGGIVSMSKSGTTNWVLALKSSGLLTYQAIGSLTALANTAIVPFDANSDGITDVLSASTATPSKWQISLGTGGSLVTLTSAQGSNYALDPVIADYDGDGRQDLLANNGNWKRQNVNFTAGSGTAGFTLGLTGALAVAPYPSTYATGTLHVGNIEANGMDDLVYALFVPGGGGAATFHYAPTPAMPAP